MKAVEQISYDKRLGRYRWQDTGKFVSKQAMLAVTERNVNAVASNIDTLSEQLIEGQISLRNWQMQTAEQLKTLHIQQYLIGRGGKAQMGPSDYGKLGAELKKQYQYLREFALDIQRGYSLDKDGNQIPMTIGRFRARIKLYSNASRIAMERGQEAGAIARGAIAAQRFLAPAIHCPECPIYAARGVVPIGTLPLPTQECTCKANCKCRIQYYTASDLVAMGLSMGMPA